MNIIYCGYLWGKQRSMQDRQFVLKCDIPFVQHKPTRVTGT